MRSAWPAGSLSADEQTRCSRVEATLRCNYSPSYSQANLGMLQAVEAYHPSSPHPDGTYEKTSAARGTR
ncbi:MAG: hypothetical protein ACI8TP_004967 [Acidimicrobiales bacterium]|jgi:hypothetical protein